MYTSFPVCTLCTKLPHFFRIEYYIVLRTKANLVQVEFVQNVVSDLHNNSDPY